jgi:hypothetical protein
LAHNWRNEGRRLAVKMKTTKEVEFEGLPDQPENVLSAALMRGKGDLQRDIEYGVGAGPTGIKGGLVKVTVVPRPSSRLGNGA